MRVVATRDGSVENGVTWIVCCRKANRKSSPEMIFEHTFGMSSFKLWKVSARLPQPPTEVIGVYSSQRGFIRCGIGIHLQKGRCSQSNSGRIVWAANWPLGHKTKNNVIHYSGIVRMAVNFPAYPSFEVDLTWIIQGEGGFIYCGNDFVFSFVGLLCLKTEMRVVSTEKTLWFDLKVWWKNGLEILSSILWLQQRLIATEGRHVFNLRAFCSRKIKMENFDHRWVLRTQFRVSGECPHPLIGWRKPLLLLLVMRLDEDLTLFVAKMAKSIEAISLLKRMKERGDRKGLAR